MAIERIPHVIRFGVAGGLATLLQLTLLAALVDLGSEKSFAHIIALIASAQVSFFLNREVTWSERRTPNENGTQLIAKLARFNGMIAVSMLVNQLTFMIAVPHVQYLVAGAFGVAVAAGINYTVSDRLVFSAQRT